MRFYTDQGFGLEILDIDIKDIEYLKNAAYGAKTCD